MTARFPDRLRLPLEFEPARLAADMDAVAASGWIAHFVKQNYDGDWSVIPLRAPAGARHPVQMIYPPPNCTDYVDTELLAGARYFRAVLEAFACPLLAVRLMRLAPGSLIKEHRDHELSFEEGVVRMKPQNLLINLPLSDPHSVANSGPADRVHMVIDATVNGWIEQLFETAAAATAAA